MTEEAADDAAQIAQIAPNEFVHQVGLGPVDRAADFEIDRGVARLILERVKILANRGEELSPHLVI